MAAPGHQPTTKGADGLHRAATDGGRWRNNKFNASEHEEVPTRTHDGNKKIEHTMRAPARWQAVTREKNLSPDGDTVLWH